jgi:hypothetical protein
LRTPPTITVGFLPRDAANSSAQGRLAASPIISWATRLESESFQ